MAHACSPWSEAHGRQGIRNTLVVALLVLFVGVGASAQADQTLRLAYVGSADGPWGDLANSLAEAVANRGISVKHFPLVELGGEKFAIELLLSGKLQMAAISGSTLARDVWQFSLLNLPFLAGSIGEARKIMTKVAPSLQQSAQAKGLRFLGTTWTVVTFVSAGRCILLPDDLRSTRVVVGPPSYRQVLPNAVVFPGRETYYALLAGATNSGFFAVDFIQTASISKVTNCLTDPTKIAAVLPVVLVSNQSTWKSLDDRTRNTLMAAVADLERLADQKMTDLVAEVVKAYLGDGKSAESMDDTAFKKWRELKLVKPLYDSFADQAKELLGAAITARDKG